MTRLKGKVALITGGASGIGEATVRLFVEEGASVMVADIQDDRGKRLADELGARAGYVHTDVSQEGHVKAAVEETCRRFGRLDCIFNNAGYGGVGGKIEDVSADGFDATIGVLLRGVFLGMKHAAPVMKKQGAGSIISTASVAGLRTGLGPHIYSAAKAAVIHLTHSVAMELGEHGVRVNCICPGAIATPIFGKSHGALAREGGRDHPHDEGRPGELPADQETRRSRRHRAGRPLAGQRRVDLRQRPRPRGGRWGDRRATVVGEPAAPRGAALRRWGCHERADHRREVRGGAVGAPRGGSASRPGARAATATT